MATALAVAIWIIRPSGDQAPPPANGKHEAGDLEATFSGPAFSSQASVADLKQASVETVDELMASYPDSPDAWNVLAQLQFHLGNTPDAIEIWDRCLAARPEMGDALYGLAYIALLKGDNAEAVQRFRTALAANPTDGRIPLLLAESLTLVGQPELAVPLLEERLKNSQSSLILLVALGQAYLDSAQYEKALKIFEATVKIDPKNREARFALCTIWARLGDKEKAKQAREAFKSLVAGERPRSTARVQSFDDMAKGREVAVLIHNKAAEAYRAQGALDKAEEAWAKASVLNPQDLKSRQELVALYEQTGRDRSALKVCEQLRDIEPGNPDFWLNIGVLNARLSRYDSALAAVEEAIKLDPANPRYRQTLELIRSSE